jgi:quinol monooxygenase YgiN
MLTALPAMAACTIMPSTAFASSAAPFVRIAELDIDPVHLAAFHAAVRESVETSVRVEPDVLALHAVADKERPTHVTVFEIYSSSAAYDRHRETPHFRKFFTTTQTMVLKRRLIDTTPIAMQAKP